MSFSWLPPPVLVAGPCVLEDDALNVAVGERLAELQAQLGLRVLFKASFDKANRATPGAPRGPGLDLGLERLTRVRAETGLSLVTDVHETEQIASVADVVDVIQIPAFLCRQTDLLQSAGRSGRAVNIKKGQWMAPEAMTGAVDKVRGGGAREIAVTERGTFFGYGDLVVDMRNFDRLRATGAAILFDATHAVQRPGQGAGGTAAGDREAIPGLMRAAAAAGVDGFFLETHPDPAEAPSDGATMIPLEQLADHVERALDVWHAARAGVPQA